MAANSSKMRWGDRGRYAALAALALAAASCSSGGGISLPSSTSSAPSAAAPPSAAPSSAAPSSASSFKDKIAGFFETSSAKAPQQVAGIQELADCPFIEIRQGASTLTIGGGDNGDGAGGGAMAVKYEGTFVRAARECAAVAGNMVMKVGVQGRIIVGPAGGPGQVDVPLRIAVVRETTAGIKPIVTRFVSIPVMVASQTDNPTFTHIEEGLTFPMPPSRDLDNYLVYIGFDPLAAETQAKAKPAPKAKPKAKAKPTAPTG